MSYAPRPRRATGSGGLLTLLLLFLALTTAYANVVPPFEGPDSGAHLRFVAWLQELRGRPPLDERTATESHELVYQPPLYYALAAAFLGPTPARPALALEVLNPHWPTLSARATVTPPEVPGAVGLPMRLAALLSLWGGLLAIIATWGIGRNIVPASPTFALAAAAVVGLNPQLVFSAATVTNDTWAAGTAALAVWLGARALRRQAAPRAWAAVGAAVGLSMLAKYSGVVVLAPVGGLWLAYAARRGMRHGVGASAWLGGGAILVAGLWYGENWLRWGAPIPSARFQAILPQLFRSAPTSWERALGEIPWLQRSYWGVFGHGVVAPSPYPQIVDGLVGLAVVGLLVLGARWWRARGSWWEWGPRSWSADDRAGGTPLRGVAPTAGPADTAAAFARPESASAHLSSRSATADVRQLAAVAALAAMWLVPAVVALLEFSRNIKFGLHGRLLFPAAGAAALLLVAGWTALTPRRAWPAVHAVVPLAFTLLALWQLLVLRQAYALPPEISGSDTAVEQHTAAARFEGGMLLAKIETQDDPWVRAGEPYSVQLYYGATGRVDGFYRRVLALVDTTGHPIAQVDGVPAAGRHPTRQWRPGALFTETVRLEVPAVNHGEAASLVVRFYDPQTGEASGMLDGAGRAAAEEATVRRLRLVGADDDRGDCPPSAAVHEAGPLPGGRWENGLTLAANEVTALSPDPLLDIRLKWTTANPPAEDLTVFVHALDATGQLVAQSDHRPQGGRLPTDLWLPCEQVADEHRLTVPFEGWEQLIVGWYGADLRRVPLVGGGDHHVLARRQDVVPVGWPARR